MTTETKTGSFVEGYTPTKVEPKEVPSVDPSVKDQETVLKEIADDSLVRPQQYLRDSVAGFGE